MLDLILENLTDIGYAAILLSLIHIFCDALKRKGIKLLECPSRVEAKEKLAINFVALEPGLIVMPSGCPRSQELLEKNGIKVIPLCVDEILKGFGAMHCCSAFLKRG